MTLTAMRPPFASREDALRRTGLMLGLTGFAVGGFFLSQAYGGILYALLAVFAALTTTHAAAPGGIRAAAPLSGLPGGNPHAATPREMAGGIAGLSGDASATAKIAPARTDLSRQRRKPLPPSTRWGNPTLSRVAAADAARETRQRLLEQGQSRNAKPGGRRMP